MDNSEACPTEDAVQALLEYLVDPLLPAKPSTRDIPLQAVQESVAKQVHAVVLLYNYYHRKKHPHLEYLCLEAFCKLATVFRPTLLLHMKLMKESTNNGVNDLQEQTSLLERIIMDACDVCTGLDVLSDLPSIEKWPIRKVAVFIVDSKRKNCYLQHSLVTQGVWSLIEKAVDDSNHSLKCRLGQEHIEKKKAAVEGQQRDEGKDSEIVFQKLAFSAVKEATGVNRKDVVILESHVVYSLNVERTAARFYILQCTSENNVIGTVPIEDVINSLQGPLFEKSSSVWTITPVVEYFHILPFVDILSDWFSRPVDPVVMKQKGAESAFADVEDNGTTDVAEEPEVQVTTEVAGNSGSRENAASKRTDDGDVRSSNPLVGSESAYTGIKGNGRTEVAKEPKVRLTSEVARVDNSESRRKSASERTKDSKGFLVNPLFSTRSACEGAEGNRRTEVAKKPEAQVTTEVPPIGDAGRSRKIVASKSADDGIVCPGSPLLGSFGGQPNGYGNGCSYENDGLYQNRVSTVQANNSAKRMCPDKENPSNAKKNGSEVESDSKVIQLKADHRETGVQKRKTVVEESSTLTDKRHSSHTPNSGAVSAHNSNLNLDKLQATIVSKAKLLSETALRVLLCKRDKLILEHRSIEDEIAKCDKSIQTIIEGGENDWELKLESIIESCNDVYSRSIAREATTQQSPDKLACQYNKRVKLSKPLPHIKSPCQELDDICYENNWILPTYRLSLSDGGFEAEVRLKETHFEYSTRGNPRPNPQEARESAASTLLAELQTSTNPHSLD